MKNIKTEQLIEEFLKFAPPFRKNVAHPPQILNGFKFTPHHHFCLIIIHKNPDVSMSNLADKLGVSNQQLTRIVEYLVHHNLVTRCIDPKNRRIILINVSDEGKKALEEFRRNIKEVLLEPIEKLSDNELDKCLFHLQELNKILSDKL